MGVPTTTTRELHYHGTLRPTLCGLNMSCRALVRTVSSSRPSEAISMDQPGEGKQLLPQRQYNFETVFPRSPQPQPQPVVVGPYMSIFELFYYLITSYHYLATVYCSLPPPPYAACVMPLRAHPLAAVCATAPGGWAPGQGARGKANHCISMRAPTG